MIHRLSEPTTIIEIASILGCGEKTVRRAIKRLYPVVRPVSGGNRIPYTYEIAYDMLPDDLRKELRHNGNGNHANPL